MQRGQYVAQFEPKSFFLSLPSKYGYVQHADGDEAQTTQRKNMYSAHHHMTACNN